MKTLYRNDPRGEFPESWYTATATFADPRPALDGDARVDVCVIGAGFTGLCAALELAGRGFNVIVLEAHRAGFGASGRNGGQVGSGFNKSQKWLQKSVGNNAARAMWDMAEAAKEQVRRFCETHAPDARFLPGVAHGAYSSGEERELAENAEFLRKYYDYDQVDVLDSTGFRDLVMSPKYTGGVVDWGAGHIHPLRYVLGLARAAEAAGARICEMTEATRIEHGTPARIKTPTGTVTADHVILAGNGYLPDLDGQVAARVMPINSFMAATAPLTPEQKVLAKDIAAADSKFVVNYFRMSEDNRFLFGGRESYGHWLPLRYLGPADQPHDRHVPATQGRQDRLCLGRNAGHHHDPSAHGRPHRAQYPQRLGVFRPWRGAFGLCRHHHGRGDRRSGRTVRCPLAASGATIPGRFAAPRAPIDPWHDMVRPPRQARLLVFSV